MNRWLYVLYAALLLLLSIPLCPTNHMELLTTMTGEFVGVSLGRSMCSIDFNGDGVRDLIALEKNWNPNGALDTSMVYGKINFYWGGSYFDNIADYAIPGTYNKQYAMGRIVNAGDVNNDGIEDLCYWGSEQNQEKICIFYGRQDPVTTPDVTLTFPHTSVARFGYFFPLGDINNDNHADIGYVTINADYQNAKIQVLDGATLTSTLLCSAYTLGTLASSVSGVGDVNNDGIADYHISRAFIAGDNTHNSLSLYYGSNQFPICDSLVISSDTNSIISPQACPLGDVNGDGIDDFVSFMNWTGAKVWLGSSFLNSQWDFVIDDIFTTSDGYDLVHGDFNNDGYEDFMGSNYHYGGDDGRAYVWLGGQNPNGTVDLTIPRTVGVAEQFGWAKAAGDFNDDGYCDVAISQPYANPAPLATAGRIFIYLGNAQLADTSVAVEDNIVPSVETLWDINIYPNPLSKNGNAIKIEFAGDGYRTANNLTLELYNIKGQKMGVYTVDQIGAGKTTWETKLNLSSAGVYIVKICADNNALTTRTFTLR